MILEEVSMKSNPIPTRLFYLNKSPSSWRRAFMLFYILSKDRTKQEVSLDIRDLLPDVGLPREAWIDFRVLDRWRHEELPIPLISIFEYIINIQEPDGLVSLNGVPNSGATYRFVEMAGLLGLSRHSSVIKAMESLKRNLNNGGLGAPGPVEGAILEVGTTARFLNVLCSYFPDETKAIDDMSAFLIGRLYRVKDRSMAFWHTDREPEELKTLLDGIIGATTLALYALAKASKITINDAEAICNWLIWSQNEDGGWPDKRNGSSNMDNTFNAIRALNMVKDSVPVSYGIKEKITKSIQKALSYVSVESTTASITTQAMRLRALIVSKIDPLSEEPIITIEALINKRDLWYHPNRDLYREVLLTSIAISEWCHAVKKRYGSLKKLDNQCVEDFLLRCPLEIPPFFSGYKDSVGEQIANWLTRQRCKLSIINAVSESLTLHDIVAQFLSFLFMVGFFVNTDLMKAILINGDRLINLGIISVITIAYTAWLYIKFKLRENFIHFLITTSMSLVLAYIVVFIWLKRGYDILMKADLLSLLRLMFLYAMVLDIGRRIVDISRLNRLFLPKGR